MKNCPICSASLDDDAKFCTQCGANIEKVPLCPSCGRPLKEGSKFSVYCGSKINSANEVSKLGVDIDAPKEDSSSDTTCTNAKDTNTTNNQAKSSENYNEPPQSSPNNSGLVITITVTVTVLIMLGVLLFSLSRINKADSTQQNDTTSVSMSSEEELNDIPPSISIEEEVRAELESIVSTNDETYILTLKDDYEAEACDEAEWGDSIKYFKKGEVLFDTNINWIRKTDGGFTDYERGEREYFIPDDVVHAKTYKLGIIPNSILDKAILRFTAKNGRQLHLYKLNRNGHTLYDYERDENVYGDIYLFSDNQECYFLYDKGVCGDGTLGPCNEESETGMVDLKGNMSCDIGSSAMNGWPFVYCYIPSKKAFLNDGVFYYLSAVEDYTVEKKIHK